MLLILSGHFEVAKIAWEFILIEFRLILVLRPKQDWFWFVSSIVTIFGDLSQIWLLLTPIWYQNFFLATWPFWLLFWLLLKTWQKTGFGVIEHIKLRTLLPKCMVKFTVGSSARFSLHWLRACHWVYMFRPAFGCVQHPKAGQNTQH